MISRSVLPVRRIPWLKLPAASKRPARKPLRQSGAGFSGQPIRPSIVRTSSRRAVLMAVIRWRWPTPG